MATTWTILKMIEWLTGYLKDKAVQSPRLDAEHLMAHALRLSRMDLYLQFERVLTKDELSKLKPLIERRAKREPLQYIIRNQPFRHVDLEVDRNVLIPRPETEIVVDEVLKLISADSDMKVLEIGVGSGAICASLAHERKNISITGIEISAGAIAVARKNVGAFSDRVELLQGNLFEPVMGRRFDLIVSNPPYCASADWLTLESEVKDYEPKEALLAGEDGLDFYRRILNDAPNHLTNGGWIILEIGDGQKNAIIAILEKTGGYADVKVAKDLNNKDRVLCAINQTA